VLKVIDQAARNCYQSKGNDTEAFIKSLLKRNHMTPFEMVDVRVKLVTDRGVMSEITRHRLASFNIESTRYVNYKDGITVVMPVGLRYYKDIKDLYSKEGNEQYQRYQSFRRAIINAEEAYIEMLDAGCAPQIARSVLPNALRTTIIMKANLRNWLHIFKLRCSSGAHPQMQLLMKDLRDKFRERIPVIFDESN